MELHWQETPWKQMLIESYCFHSIQPSFLSQRTNVTSNRKELDFPTKSAELHMQRNRHNISLKSAWLMVSLKIKNNKKLVLSVGDWDGRLGNQRHCSGRGVEEGRAGMWEGEGALLTSSGPQSGALPLSSPVCQFISSPDCHLKQYNKHHPGGISWD